MTLQWANRARFPSEARGFGRQTPLGLTVKNESFKLPVEVLVVFMALKLWGTVPLRQLKRQLAFCRQP